MYRNSPMILVEYGPVIIRKDAHNEVSFATVDELNFYAASFVSGVLNDKEYFNYDPQNHIHIDSINNITEWTGPLTKYDRIINAYDQIAARKADPLYGLIGQDLEDAMERKRKWEEWEAKRLAYHQAARADGLVTVSIDQVSNYLDNRYDTTALDAALTTLNAASTAAEVKAALIPAFLEVRKLFAQSKEVDLRIAKALLANALEPEA